MALRLAPSSVTLGGLLRHLAWVEELYFQQRLAGRPVMAPFDRLDLETDWEDWPWRTAADDTPSALRTLWIDAVHRSRASLAEALSNRELDQPTHSGMSLRRLLADIRKSSEPAVDVGDAYQGGSWAVLRCGVCDGSSHAGAIECGTPWSMIMRQSPLWISR